MKNLCIPKAQCILPFQQILFTIMHNMPNFYYLHYVLDYLPQDLLATHLPATIGTTEHQKRAQDPPPCRFPMASTNCPRIHCWRGSTKRTSIHEDGSVHLCVLEAVCRWPSVADTEGSPCASQFHPKTCGGPEAAPPPHRLAS